MNGEPRDYQLELGQALLDMAGLRAELSDCKSSLRAAEAEVERWAAQALKEDECRQMWQARAEAAEAREKAETIEECLSAVDAVCHGHGSDHDKIRFIRARLRALASKEGGNG